MKHICSKCVYYVINKNKAYCENDMWKEMDLIKSKTLNPFLFECFDYEELVKTEFNKLIK